MSDERDTRVTGGFLGLGGDPPYIGGAARGIVRKAIKPRTVLDELCQRRVAAGAKLTRLRQEIEETQLEFDQCGRAIDALMPSEPPAAALTPAEDAAVGVVEGEVSALDEFMKREGAVKWEGADVYAPPEAPFDPATGKYGNVVILRRNGDVEEHNAELIAWGWCDATRPDREIVAFYPVIPTPAEESDAPGADVGEGVFPPPPFEVPEGFVRWQGGKQPVADGQMVEYIYASGQRSEVEAEWLDWHHAGASSDIIAYRVLTPSPDSVRNDSPQVEGAKLVSVDASGIAETPSSETNILHREQHPDTSFWAAVQLGKLNGRF